MAIISTSVIDVVQWAQVTSSNGFTSSSCSQSSIYWCQLVLRPAWVLWSATDIDTRRSFRLSFVSWKCTDPSFTFFVLLVIFYHLVHLPICLACSSVVSNSNTHMSCSSIHAMLCTAAEFISSFNWCVVLLKGTFDKPLYT